MDATAHDLLAAIRAVHFGAIVVLFGQFAYLFRVAPDGKRPPEFGATAAWSLGIAVVSHCAWLAMEASSMSGLPMGEALRGPVLGTVLLQTFFGHVWIFRMVAAACLGVALAFGVRGDERSGAGTARTVAGALATVFLASTAGAGHAAADPGFDRYIHLGVDMLHLVGAGAWVGALLPFALLLRRCIGHRDGGSLAAGARAAQRFAALGMASVAVLMASGVVNAWYIVGEVRALFGSPYGRLLLAKVSLFLVMLGLAAVNRIVLTPRLSDPGLRMDAARRLFRNAALEIALGFAVVAIVGVLGITMPVMHAH